MSKLDKYHELEAEIGELIVKNNKTPKEFEKLDKLYDQQAELESDLEVIEHIISFANKIY